MCKGVQLHAYPKTAPTCAHLDATYKAGSEYITNYPEDIWKERQKHPFESNW